MKVYTIPAALPFARTLAAGLLARADGAPEKLSEMLILLPSRRAARSLREAFLDLSEGRALLLPRMKPLGDVDAEELALGWPDLEDIPDALDIPPALPPLRRRILLARAILQRGDQAGSWEQALALADALGRFLDHMLIEERPFEDLAGLVPADYADHWGITLEFLEILTAHWPAILAEQGCIEAAERRRIMMERQMSLWQARPPGYPVIAAGSTGSIPATGRMLALVAALPQGEVILPGYDAALDEASWEALEPSHPQWGFRHLFQQIDLPRGGVTLWPGCPAGEPDTGRSLLAREIMRPAATAERWMQLGEEQAAIQRGLAGISLAECQSLREEAGVIALALREALEQPGRTAALVTPDRMLAVAVSQQLGRWGLRVDDSAGAPLSQTAPARLMLLLWQACAEGLRPAALLALLRHPFSPLNPADTDLLERTLLRGARPKPGMAGLRLRLESWAESHPGRAQAQASLEGVWRIIDPVLQPLLDLMESTKPLTLKDYMEVHIRCAERLAGENLWSGEDGEALSDSLSTLLQQQGLLEALTPADYAGILGSVLQTITVRPRYGTHPRLQILGQIEARMSQADLLVLGGLNEGTWPPDPGHDPWMSRPMRRALGLPDAERSIGLAAHDFVQALGAKEVLFTRAAVKDGAPTVPGRWLRRLEAVLEACRLPKSVIQNAAYRLYWECMDKPNDFDISIRPDPKPSLAARPSRLSVTAIQTWLEDPYQIYARHVLDLKALEPLEKPVDPADRGSLIHAVLERFIHDHPEDLPPEAQEKLMALIHEEIERESIDPAALHFFWPRFEAMMRWFAGQEALWRKSGARPYLLEGRGEWALQTAQGHPFTLTGRADRIDRLKGGSSHAIIDYKAGGDYKASQIESGRRPQLPLEGLMLEAGAFRGLAPAKAGMLAYWVLKGTRGGGEVAELSEQADSVLTSVRALLEGLIDRYAQAEIGYPAQPDPRRVPDYNDYAHLARLQEWGGERTEGEG